ncbi:hypothetical protein P9869_23985 [Streptomyces ossamyceticus]|nr:hypothetical protein [Streptomyces ossamyceticus]
MDGWTVGAAIMAIIGSALLAVGYLRRTLPPRSGPKAKAPWWARFESEPRAPTGQRKSEQGTYFG